MKEGHSKIFAIKKLLCLNNLFFSLFSRKVPGVREQQFTKTTTVSGMFAFLVNLLSLLCLGIEQELKRKWIQKLSFPVEKKQDEKQTRAKLLLQVTCWEKQLFGGRQVIRVLRIPNNNNKQHDLCNRKYLQSLSFLSISLLAHISLLAFSSPSPHACCLSHWIHIT